MNRNSRNIGTPLKKNRTGDKVTFTLTKKTLRLWQVRTAAVVAVLAVAILIFFGAARYSIIATAVILVLGAAVIFVYLPIYHKMWRLTVDHTAVEVECGVIIRVNHIMPYPRMIYTNCYATPLGRMMGLEGLVLKAARGRLFLPELDSAEIVKILDVISGEERGN